MIRVHVVPRKFKFDPTKWSTKNVEQKSQLLACLEGQRISERMSCLSDGVFFEVEVDSINDGGAVEDRHDQWIGRSRFQKTARALPDFHKLADVQSAEPAVAMEDASRRVAGGAAQAPSALPLFLDGAGASSGPDGDPCSGPKLPESHEPHEGHLKDESERADPNGSRCPHRASFEAHTRLADPGSSPGPLHVGRDGGAFWEVQGLDVSGDPFGLSVMGHIAEVETVGEAAAHPDLVRLATWAKDNLETTEEAAKQTKSLAKDPEAAAKVPVPKLSDLGYRSSGSDWSKVSSCPAPRRARNRRTQKDVEELSSDMEEEEKGTGRADRSFGKEDCGPEEEGGNLEVFLCGEEEFSDALEDAPGESYVMIGGYESEDDDMHDCLEAFEDGETTKYEQATEVQGVPAYVKGDCSSRSVNDCGLDRESKNIPITEPEGVLVNDDTLDIDVTPSYDQVFDYDTVPQYEQNFAGVKVSDGVFDSLSFLTDGVSSMFSKEKDGHMAGESPGVGNNPRRRPRSASAVGGGWKRARWSLWSVQLVVWHRCFWPALLRLELGPMRLEWNPWKMCALFSHHPET